MRRYAAVVALVGLVLAGGCTRAGSRTAPAGRSPAAGSSAAFRPGADGLGDPYFATAGNGGYDVASYDLGVRYDPGSDTLTGHALITATATADLSRFNLDLSGLTVNAVAVNGAPAQQARHGAELVIAPAAGLPNGRRFTVDIAYGGVPATLGSPGLGAEGFLHTADGALAVGEPHSASSWFPVNDHPSDKATYAVAVTVPAGLAALSNGSPTGSSTVDGWTTWKWVEQAPMASYLATVVIGKYRVRSTTHDGKPVVTAVAESIANGPADRAMARTPEVIDYLATQFGPYPFEALGGIVQGDPRIGFALENQTRPVYSSGFFRSGDNAEILAHELAHQWYGDSVSVQQWKDIWLNEGFATYAQWLWREHTGGPTVAESFGRAYGNAAATSWNVPPADPGPDMFGRGNFAIYQRGAMALYAVRVAIGADAFARLLKTWAAEKRHANATTAEFIAVAERVSGQSLRQLLDAWLYQPRKPPAPGR